MGRKSENFDYLTFTLDKAEKLYEEYEVAKSEKEKWKIIKQVVDLVEINPKYNFELLKLNKNFEKKDYEYISIN